MRARDVGIGLAVAWARMRGPHYTREGLRGRIPHFYPMRFRCPWDLSKGWLIIALWDSRAPGCWRNMQPVDRGPVVEPETLTDTRVAFGIAMAHAGPWKKGGHAVYGHGIVYGRLATGDVMLFADELVRVDLDPRRWRFQRCTPRFRCGMPVIG